MGNCPDCMQVVSNQERVRTPNTQISTNWDVKIKVWIHVSNETIEILTKSLLVSKGMQVDAKTGGWNVNQRMTGGWKCRWVVRTWMQTEVDANVGKSTWFMIMQIRLNYGVSKAGWHAINIQIHRYANFAMKSKFAKITAWAKWRHVL